MRPIGSSLPELEASEAESMSSASPRYWCRSTSSGTRHGQYVAAATNNLGDVFLLRGVWTKRRNFLQQADKRLWGGTEAGA